MAKIKDYRAIKTPLFLAITREDFTRACYKVVMVVIHYTLGYDQRTEAQISHKTFMKLTGLSRPAVREALRQLHAGNVVIEVKKGYSTNNSTVYAFNTDFETWQTGKVRLPSTRRVHSPNKDAKTYLVDSQYLPSTGQVLTPTTTHIKKERKLINKDNDSSGYGIEPTPTPSNGITTLRENAVVEEPTHLKENVNYPSGKSHATRGLTSLPDKKDTNPNPPVAPAPLPLKGHKSTHGDRIEAFLRSHGPAPIKAISQATGIDRNSVNTTLHLAKGKRFQHFPQERAWDIAEKADNKM